MSNGVGIRNLAGRTARKLSQLGVTVLRVSDYQLFGRQRTEIHYRIGYLPSAESMQKTLPVKARLVRSSKLSEGVNLRLVIGKDLVTRRIAWLDDDAILPGTMALEAVNPVTDLALHSGKVARADVNDGWRFL